MTKHRRHDKESVGMDPTTEASVPSDNENDNADSAAEHSPAWRQEIAARLNRYQARRKPRPPRYPSLRLPFDEEASSASSSASEHPPVTASHYVVTQPSLTHKALALGEFTGPQAPPGTQLSQTAAERALATAQPTPQFTPQTTAQTTAKIIEFPRSWTPPPAPLNELAEPVMDRPRILEAPEVLPPPPALGGIAIESAPQPAQEKRPGIDIPLQSASLGRRIFSAAVDDAIIAVACAMFGFIFWKITAVRPPRFQIVGLAAGLSGALWAAYQYLLVVYSGTTPGLRLAGLELARFDGGPTGRRLRRWRVLASFLSAVSLGLGYAWIFLDEDALCWHDRITHTYIAPKGHELSDSSHHA